MGDNSLAWSCVERLAGHLRGGGDALLFLEFFCVVSLLLITSVKRHR